MRSGGGRLFGGCILGFILAIVVGAVVIVPLALTHRSAGALETKLADFAVGLTTRLGARNTGPNPVAGTPRALEAGVTAYNGVCAQCHGAAGQGDGLFAQSVFPPATDLTSDTTRQLSDAQLFYIIKNGLGFTPMPAYGSQYSDQTIWSMVSYIRELQNGQGGRLPVGTPTSQQASTAQVPAGGDAQRGAVLFRSNGCVVCHGSAPGQVALDPTNTMIAQAVRLGQPSGMPCFPTSRISDDELNDIRAYIATFPALAAQSGPQGQPGRGPGGPGGGGAGGQAGPGASARPGGPGGVPGGEPGGQAGGPPPGALSPCASGAGVSFPGVPGVRPSATATR
jgi:mono/diheme cytochrome c family protein